MNKNFLFGFIIFVLFAGRFLPQQDDNLITVVGKKMIGKTINGETIREVFGDVVVTQGNIRVTCDHAIHFISNN
jgi:hypothetical protein